MDGQSFAVVGAAGDTVAFSPVSAEPRPAAPFAPTPGKIKPSVSLRAIDDLMAEFGNAVIGNNVKPLALDTMVDGLFAGR